MTARSGEPLLKTNAVVSSGLASAAAALFTSRFGMAGTLLGAALTSMIITGGSALVGFYLGRAATKARNIPPKVQEKLGRSGESAGIEIAGVDSRGQGRPKPLRLFRLLHGPSGRWGLAWGKLLGHPNTARRRTIRSAYGVLLGVPVSFLIGLAIITSLEFGASKSLSCWAWERCPEPVATASTSYAHPLDTQTWPTILGGGARNDASPPLRGNGSADQYGP